MNVFILMSLSLIYTAGFSVTVEQEHSVGIVLSLGTRPSALHDQAKANSKTVTVPLTLTRQHNRVTHLHLSFVTVVSNEFLFSYFLLFFAALF